MARRKMDCLGVVGRFADVVDVTLSLDTSAYTAGDVLAATQEVAGTFRLSGMTGLLTSLVVIDEDDQAAAFTVYFLDADVSMGTENSAPDITDANARHVMARVAVATGDYTDLGGVRVAVISGINQVIKSAGDTTSMYVAVVNGAGTPTYTASGIKLRIGIQQD